MDFQFKENERMDKQMVVIDNLAILKKWTNGQTLAKITLAMPDHLRLEYIKRCNCNNLVSPTDEELKLFKEIAIFMMEENLVSDPHQNISKTRVNFDEDLTKTAHQLKKVIKKFHPTLPKEDIDALAKADFLRTIPNTIKIHLKTHTNQPLHVVASIAQTIKQEIHGNQSTILDTSKAPDDGKLDQVIDILKELTLRSHHEQRELDSYQRGAIVCYPCDKSGQLSRVCQSHRRQQFRGTERFDTFEKGIESIIQMDHGHKKEL
ncbi:hypothetical protein RF11_04396 [Thelohanellus kitauei]|uniref:Uncharacterized protein n=1 Tax=Thelohanellus kitauei TaxID=669202 RepID=A0A0C2MVZ3_THEKT|nr:hypothetical protein RF11_04396 [Thelohanellus kitauei]